MGKVTKCKATTISEQSQQRANDRIHFMKYCLTHPNKFSCAVESFLEHSFSIFKDYLKHIDCNELFEMLLEVCLQLENYDVQTKMTAVPEPIWAYLRQHCNSFAAMSGHVEFSDIFT